MEHSENSHTFRNGKDNSHSEHMQMVLRSGSVYGGSSERYSEQSLTRNEGSPILRTRIPDYTQHRAQQSHFHHHHHHHHHHVHQHLPKLSDVQNHQVVSHEHQQREVTNGIKMDYRVQAQKSQAREFEVSRKRSAELHHHSYSDYSSGNDDVDTDEEVKTDYTYAKSGSYRTRVTPTRQCPSPNMSRCHLRRTSASYNSLISTDVSVEYEDDVNLRAQSFTNQSSQKRFLGSSTSSVISHGMEDKLMSLHSEFGDQVSVLSDYSSQNILTETVSIVSTWVSTISRTIYDFISTATSVDTYLLSRFCGSRKRKLWAFLFFLLPLLFLLLFLQPAVDITKYLSLNYLSSILSSQSSQASLLTGSHLVVDGLSSVEAQKLQAQWQFEVERRLHEELKQKWLDQSRQMENLWLQQRQRMDHWQQTFVDQTRSMNIKSLNEEVLQLKSVLESQSRKEDTERSATQGELKLILERLNHLEEKQKVLETLLLGLEDCCRKQGALPVGVSRDELAVQLSALAEEVRTNISQLVLLQSSAATSSKYMEDVQFMHKFNSSNSAVTFGDIEKIVKVAIARYDADKTGMVDYALESAGGSVVSTRCTESYPLGTAQFSLFGVPFWYSANTPRTVIQPQVHPGECWAMRGTQGYLVIQLSAVIRPTAFSLEHIPKGLSPTGKIDSAPKEFSVFGLKSEKDTDGHLLGKYVYIDDGEPLQKFNVQSTDNESFSIVELRVHSNHGNPEYTCLYRFRVHGIRL